ncbi:MAG: histidine kinase dimerization/phospho-acceptor domain-containing protein, partial [Ktedonobacteraceae bacterium]
MEKNPPPVSHTHAKKGHRQSGIPPAKRPISGYQSHAAPEKSMSLSQQEAIFASLPDAVLVCDRDGKLLCMNDTALKLFEVSSPHHWLGISYGEFLQHYTWCDEQQRPIFLAPWLLSLINDAETIPYPYEQTVTLDLPSGRRVLLELRCSLLLDTERQTSGTISLFREVTPRYQQALHLQRVYEAISILNEAIAHIPEHLSFTLSDEMLLLSPPVLFVAQQLVDVIHQVLACWRVSLVALGSQAHHFAYAVGSGFTAEQEQQRRELRGHFVSTEIVDEAVLASLYAHQEVIIGADRLRIPPGHPADFGAANLLCIPLFLEQRLAGVLLVAKQGWGSGYSQEEIDLVKDVAAEALLLIECLGNLQKEVGQQIRELVLQEVDRLSRDFLMLAGHELRTPLTGIKGNVQLAQRRLTALRRHIIEQSACANTYLEHAQQSLAQAEQSVRLQERMVQDMIDDTRIQANQLDLSLKPCDLLALIKVVVTKQQASVPKRVVKLKNLTNRYTIPVLADTERIIQVLTIYLANALNYSPTERSVTIQVTEESGLARVSVHDEGTGISLDEQGHLWERFYRGT